MFHMPSTVASRLITFGLLALAAFTYIKNFWLNEDAFIAFRSLAQLQAGNGAVWNSNERVQVYTSVAWYWLLAAADAIVHNIFITTIAISGLLFAGLLMLLLRRYGNGLALCLLLLCCLLSKGFFDYTSSGLENVLAYVALVLLYCRYDDTPVLTAAPGTFSTQQQITLAWLTGLMPLIRHDLVLIAAPPFALLLWQSRGDLRTVIQLSARAMAPLLLWSLASLIYYGQPLPNTAYAKLSHGFATDENWRAGMQYFYGHLTRDPITLLTILLPLPLMLLRSTSAWQKACSAGAWLYCLYLVKVGGDYMLGRFLSFPFLICMLLVADFVHRRKSQHPWPRPAIVIATVAALTYAALIPATPIVTPWSFGREADAMALVKESRISGLLNQRELHYQTTFSAWWNNDTRASGPLESFRRDGENLKKSSDRIAVRGALGTTGYYAGLDMHIVDYFALTDPLLARLPAIRRVASGHFEREIVPGYLARLADAATPLEQHDLQSYYEKIELLTRSDALFSWPRIKTIVAFNLGRYDHLLNQYRHDVLQKREQMKAATQP